MADEGNTRRLAAILAADVVDYSRLMHEDEAGTVAAWQAARRDAVDPTLEANKGRVVKRTGDGFLAEFATVEDAVRCAVAMQAALAESALDFRMGINLGDITDDGDDIHGDGVNIAARLEGLADPGGIYISGSVHDQVHNKLDLAFTDMGEQQVKNIARPVRAFKVNMGETKVAFVAASSKPTSKTKTAIAASVAAVIAIAGGLFIWEPWVTRVEPASVEKMRFPLPSKPSVAVLPFNDFSEGKTQGALADGITEDIITNLARLPSLFVVARNSTFQFKGKAVDVRTVAEDLGVRHVVEGSVRRAGDRVRITAQLIDAVSGQHIWAERFDRELKDIFEVQDEIAKSIALKLVRNLAWTQSGKRQNRNLEAYHLALQARQLVGRGNPEINKRAKALAKRAIAIDPENARAHAVLAYSHGFDAIRRWVKDTEGAKKLAYEYGQKAVQLDPGDSYAHLALGAAFRNRGEIKRAIESYNRAIALSPNSADVLAISSFNLILIGQYDEAIPRLKSAMRLNPYYDWSRPNFLGLAYFGKREFAKAAPLLEESYKLNPKSLRQTEVLAAAYAHMGQMENAAKWREVVLKRRPNYSLQAARKRFSKIPGGRLILEGMKKASFPENPPLKLPDKPSVAVLPFTNMSGDKDQEYFSDGITEDIITDLSKVSGLFVIARTSTNRYKGKSVDVRKIARELGVRYIVEGSVRKAADKVRITAQLIDASNGNHVWAERYDRDLKDVFAIQDDVSRRVVGELAVTLKANEQERLFRKHTNNVEAYDLFLRGRATLSPPSKENTKRGRKLFTRVIELDPKFAGGYAGLSYNYFVGVTLGHSKSPRRDIDRAFGLAQKAVSVDDTFGWSYIALANAHLARGEHDRAIAVVQKAVEIQPGDSDALLALGVNFFYAGMGRDAVEVIQQSQRLNPHLRSLDVARLCHAYFATGEYVKVIQLCEKAVKMIGKRSPRAAAYNLAYVAAANSLLGKDEAAKLAARRLLENQPDFSLSNWPLLRRYKRPGDRKLLREAAIKAGVPEN
jgi:adenylate cyclase